MICMTYIQRLNPIKIMY
ncbi:hypothetical protein AN2816.2 [Aspergillus nidulans FGSC A4]|nr:hypothetical protein AN2816.2 [Aspergillus nidulans FGSC A4]